MRKKPGSDAGFFRSPSRVKLAAMRGMNRFRIGGARVIEVVESSAEVLKVTPA